MTTTRYTAIILFILCTLTAKAQPLLCFTSDEWNFGTILEADGRVSHTFTGTNTSNKPMVITEVLSSCGCTMPEYSKKPILPTQTVEIKVAYDPANRPGAFIKELPIFDSERTKVATLTIRGEVIPREKGIEELYPVVAGEGLRLTESLCTFAHLYHGRAAHSVIGIANTSDRLLRLNLQVAQTKEAGHTKGVSDILQLDYPRELPAGAQGEIRITYDIPAESGLYGTVMHIVTPYTNGRKAPVRLMTHGIVVDNPNLLNEIYLPKAEIDKYILKFGVRNQDAGLQKLPFRITNTGTNTLIIRAVELGDGLGCTLRTEGRIEAGRSMTAYATIDPAKLDYGAFSEHLTIVTNDPTHPMRRVRVTAIIEE